MSKLKNCKSCGAEVAKSAKACPKCGQDQRSFFRKHKIITGILALIVIIAIGSSTGGKKDTASTSSSGSSSSSSTKEDTKVTYDNFLKINMGIKYDDVVAIVGEGKEDSSSEVGGIKTKLYSWNGSGISTMNVTIQNGVVTGKAQVGLKNMDAKVTMATYDKIQTGMSYDQVKAILGDGIISSQDKIVNIESVMYDWINADGTNMTVTFSGGKVSLKAQYGLK